MQRWSLAIKGARASAALRRRLLALLDALPALLLERLDPVDGRSPQRRTVLALQAQEEHSRRCGMRWIARDADALADFHRLVVPAAVRQIEAAVELDLPARDFARVVPDVDGHLGVRIDEPKRRYDAYYRDRPASVIDGRERMVRARKRRVEE